MPHISRRTVLLIVAAMVFSLTLTVAGLNARLRTYAADQAAHDLLATDMLIGDPRPMEPDEWDGVPLEADVALAFSVGELVGCYGCEDPMGYLLEYSASEALDRDLALARANVDRSYAADWLWEYPGLIAILPAGLNTRQAEVYRQALDAGWASRSAPIASIVSNSSSGR